MNILIFSIMPWDNTNATGNTLSNFFDGEVWKNDKFHNIYMRNALPNNSVCKDYYRLTLNDMLKNFFVNEKIGNKFTNNTKFKSKNVSNEKKYIDLIHKYSLKFIYVIEDYIYRSEKWLNRKFKKYLDEVSPDILFAPMNCFAMLHPIIRYLKNNKKTKIVLFLTDDLYGNIKNKPLIIRKKIKEDYESIIKMSDKIYAITSELQNEYSKIFNKKIDFLCKGCSIEYPIKSSINDIVEFVYAGNLLYGRDDTLEKVAIAINNSNNKNKRKGILKIYTSSSISKKLQRKLCIQKSSIILGKKDYSEIKKIMNNAEYNLQVESFDKKNSEYVKYSFSTKIIDCIQSGSSIVGIGPKNISSIKYIKTIPGAHIIEQPTDIEKDIEKLILKSNSAISDAIKIREFGEKKHNRHRNQKRIRDDFYQLIQK